MNRRQTMEAEAMKDRTSALAKLPRIGTSPIRNAAHLRHVLEDMALTLGDDLTIAKQDKEPNWWKIQDMLDDVLDLLDHANKKRRK